MLFHEVLWKATTWWNTWLILISHFINKSGRNYYQNQRKVKQDCLVESLWTQSSPRKCKTTQLPTVRIYPWRVIFQRQFLLHLQSENGTPTKQAISPFLLRPSMCACSQTHLFFIILQLLVGDKQIIFFGRWWHWSHRGHHLLTSPKIHGEPDPKDMETLWDGGTSYHDFRVVGQKALPEYFLLHF